MVGFLFWMATMRTWAIKDWDRFQHYKKPKPVWIKLYRDLLRDYAFMQLSESERWIVIGLWIIAAETGNEIPDDPEYIRTSLKLKRPPDLEKFSRLGFIQANGTLGDL